MMRGPRRGTPRQQLNAARARRHGPRTPCARADEQKHKLREREREREETVALQPESKRPRRHCGDRSSMHEMSARRQEFRNVRPRFGASRTLMACGGHRTSALNFAKVDCNSHARKEDARPSGSERSSGQLSNDARLGRLLGSRCRAWLTGRGGHARRCETGSDPMCPPPPPSANEGLLAPLACSPPRGRRAGRGSRRSSVGSRNSRYHRVARNRDSVLACAVVLFYLPLRTRTRRGYSARNSR